MESFALTLDEVVGCFIRSSDSTHCIQDGLLALVSLIFGTGGMFWILISNNRVSKWLKGKAINDKYILERFNNFYSDHAETAVLAMKKGGTIKDLKLLAVSAKANEFFGNTADFKGLIGKSHQELLEILREFMDQADYDAFVSDQERLLEEYSAGREAYAKVSVKFNDRHPQQSYKGGAFLPVVVNRGHETKKIFNRSEQVIQVNYLDLKPLIPVVENYVTKSEGPE